MEQFEMSRRPVYRMASWSYVQNITELKEGIKTKFNQIALHNSNLNVLVKRQMNVINREMQRYKRRGKYAEDSCIAVVTRDYLQALLEGAAIS